jgi:hypothetical protein
MSGLEKLVVDCIITCLIAYVVHEVIQRFAIAIAAKSNEMTFLTILLR